MNDFIYDFKETLAQSHYYEDQMFYEMPETPTTKITRTLAYKDGKFYTKLIFWSL